jgi:hypothetical protein
MTTPRNAARPQQVQVPASREREAAGQTQGSHESADMLVRRRAPDATVPRVPSEHQAFRFRY